MIKKICLLILTIVSFSTFAQDNKATIIKSPNIIPTEDNRLKIFLGGSIDMGKSEDWQARIGKQLSNCNAIILNLSLIHI